MAEAHGAGTVAYPSSPVPGREREDLAWYGVLKHQAHAQWHTNGTLLQQGHLPRVLARRQTLICYSVPCSASL